MLIQILLRRQFALFWRCVFPLRIHDYPWAFGSWHWSPGDDEFYPGHTVAQQATVACVCGRRKWGSLMYCLILMYVYMYYISWPERDDCLILFCNFPWILQQLPKRAPRITQEQPSPLPPAFSMAKSPHPCANLASQHGDLGHEPQKQHSKSTASKCFKY